MAPRRAKKLTQSLCALALLAACVSARASEYHGQVTFGGFGMPGATVTATQGSKTIVTTSGQDGFYTFADLPDGTWTITVSMQMFSPAKGEVTVSSTTTPGKWDLTLLPIDQLLAQSKLTKAVVTQPTVEASTAPKKNSDTPNAPAPADLPKPSDETASRSADAFLINGSSNNAATSQFSLAQAFGNQRSGTKSLYTGGLSVVIDNSALNARPYSLSGLSTPTDSYNRFTAAVTIGGPIRIPHILPRGPNFFIAYHFTRNNTAETLSGLVPTAAQRTGDLSSNPTQIINPATGLPYANNQVPVSPQARALLAFYPLPNIPGTTQYNYQTPVLNSTHQDALESRLDKSLGNKNQLYGGFAFQNIRAASNSLFKFNDVTDTLGYTGNINYTHRFSQHLFLFAGYRLSRQRTLVKPFFANLTNVSANAGITGNDQDPTYWGPPSLNFSSGIASLTDGQSTFNRNLTNAFNASVALYRGKHNITIGGDLRKQQFNDLYQANPRGSLAFTAAATGSDLADFLIGTPDTSAIAFGNADKYFRQPVYDLYATDDWRLQPTLTLNLGLRWEYGAPPTELKNRLVNLDVAPGFTASTAVLASNPKGPLTGQQYPNSLVRPFYAGIEPRLAVSWRPIPGSTVVVRAGYGIYDDTSVYQSIISQLAQQAPLSKSLSVSNASGCALTLANPFQTCSSTTPNTFAVDPNFRVGYAQTWQLAVQRDLPGALQATVTYLGVKGTNGVQQFLPNTYALGAANPCPLCPSGFVYRTSGGSSIRNSGQLQVRRRLRSGFTATALYTFAKSVDNDAILGGQGYTSSNQAASTASASIAQNWRDLNAERARSTFDQRHLLNLSVQYTTGQGLKGGSLMEGWHGRLLKEWSFSSQLNVGTGLPETPIFYSAIPGAGYTGTLRPNRTSASVYTAPTGLYLNAAAYSAPTPGQFGNAGRNSITGPGQFSLDTSLARTFRPSKRIYLDLRVDATNILNHGTITSWGNITNSSQFGLPLAANPMRSLQTTLRARF